MNSDKNTNRSNLLSFWKKLKPLSFLTIECNDELQSPPNKNIGHAQVQVFFEKENELIFKEEGSWQENKTRFTNTLKWKLVLDKEKIELKHLRFGKSQPTPLIEFEILSKDHLEGKKPHECGQDIYFATCHFKGKNLHLIWKIIGPKKNQILESIYRPI